MAKRPVILRDPPVLTEDRGISELSLPKWDLFSGPTADLDEEGMLLALLDHGARTAEKIARSYLLDDDWKELLRFVGLGVQANDLNLNHFESAADYKMMVRALTLGLDAEMRELLAHAFHVLSAGELCREAIQKQNLFAAAHWAHVHGESMVRLCMLKYQKSTKVGANSRAGAKRGGESRRIPDVEKTRIAKTYKVALDELLKSKPFLGDTEATNQVAAKAGVSGRKVRNYLKLLAE